MRWFWAALATALCAAAPAHSARLEPVGTGFSAPMTVVGHPTDAGKVYVVERAGVVKLLEGGTATEVLNITSLVDDAGEGGLLSIALPSNFGAAGSRVYAYFTAPPPPMGTGFTLVVASFLPGDPGSRQNIITIAHPTFQNHNGGTIAFGPDGQLWLATGDGGGSGDPGENAEDPDELLGKMLRITPSAGGGYTIPPDNPFADGADGAPEVWSIGLRNPFRYSFDRLTGDLIIGDVGQGDMEEIDFARAVDGRGKGKSYGWDTFEGTRPFEGSVAPPNYLPPLFTHTDTEDPATPYTDDFRSITGGVVVRDPLLWNDLAGCYVYTDYLRLGDHLFSADLDTGTTRQESGLTFDGVTGFGEDADGRVYLASLNTGAIRRLAPDPGAPAPPPGFSGGDCASRAPDPGDPGDDDDGGGTTTTPPTTTTPATTPPTQTPRVTPPLLDLRRPALGSRTARRQRALRRRALLLRLNCDEPCRLGATGRVTAGGRGYGLGSAVATTMPGRTRSMRVRFGPRALRAVRAALRRDRRVTATMRVRAVDAAGNATTRTLRVVITG